MSEIRLTTCGFSFECPGCGDVHIVDTTRGWAWNGSRERPTVAPSLSIASGHYASHYKQGDACWCGKNYGFTCYRCHFVLTDGVLHFQPDSTHRLAGQSVNL